MARKRWKDDPTNLIRLSLRKRLLLAMLAVTALGFILTGAATYVGFSRLDSDYNAARLERKESAVAKGLGFALSRAAGEDVDPASLSWAVVSGDFADRIVEMEAIHGLPIAVYRLDGGLFVTSSVRRPEDTGFPTEVDPDVLIALADGVARLEVPTGNGDYLAYWYQLNAEMRPVALVALRYESRSLEAVVRNEFMRNLGAVFALVFAAAVALAFFLTRSITQPLSRLGSRMDDMDVGLEVAVEPLQYESAPSDEIGVLVERYNRMVENVRRSAYALAQSERQSAWREMAMQVVHEIKNPLTPMKLGIQQLERRALDAESDPNELKDRIVTLSSTLQGQIDLLSRIAGEFSTLARLPQGELLPLSLNRLLEEVVLLHGVEGVCPTLRSDGEIQVEGDADQLKRLFSNLIINAQQAIGDGPGEVWLVLDASAECIVVKDSGPGMSKEVADRVFEPRFTTRGGGSGLGLAMVKAIAERHSWRVDFESIPGVGTEFRLQVKGPFER